VRAGGRGGGGAPDRKQHANHDSAEECASTSTRAPQEILMADPEGCPAWEASHEDQCGAMKTHADVSDVAACKALCTPDALGPGKPCLAVMYSATLKSCNVYEEQNSCAAGQEHPPPGYQQLLKLCPADACQLTKEGACEFSTTGWVFVCVLLLAGVFYITLGTAYNVTTKGLPLSTGALPHGLFWAELQGLCSDGAALIISAARGERHRGDHHGGSGAQYTAVPDAAATTSSVLDAVGRREQQQQLDQASVQASLLETGAELSSAKGSDSSTSSDDGGDSGSSDDEIIE
jgi:hypothetical protein